MTKKVYCEDCKYHKRFYENGEDWCEISGEYKLIGGGSVHKPKREKIYKTCREKNKYNNCEDYEEK